MAMFDTYLGTYCYTKYGNLHYYYFSHYFIEIIVLSLIMYIYNWK